MASSLIAGVISGVVGLLVFLVVHHFWIAPIWFIAPAGLLTAVAGGLAIGWSYFHLKGGLLGRSQSAVIATAVAGLAFALGPGHNIPMFGTNPLAFKGHAIVIIIVAASALALVESEALLRRPDSARLSE